MSFYRYPDLAKLGIPYSREHIRRLEKVGKFPMHTELGDGPGGFIGWETGDIHKHLAAKAKAAREKTKKAKAMKAVEDRRASTPQP